MTWTGRPEDTNGNNTLNNGKSCHNMGDAEKVVHFMFFRHHINVQIPLHFFTFSFDKHNKPAAPANMF